MKTRLTLSGILTAFFEFVAGAAGSAGSTVLRGVAYTVARTRAIRTGVEPYPQLITGIPDMRNFYVVFAWRNKEDRERYGHFVIPAGNIADAAYMALERGKTEGKRVVRVSEVGYQ